MHRANLPISLYRGYLFVFWGAFGAARARAHAFSRARLASWTAAAQRRKGKRKTRAAKSTSASPQAAARAQIRAAALEGDRGEKVDAIPCAFHVVSPRDLWLCVLPRWQLNVNVNVVDAIFDLT